MQPTSGERPGRWIRRLWCSGQRENLLAGQPPGNNGDYKQEFVALAKESYCPIS